MIPNLEAQQGLSVLSTDCHSLRSLSHQLVFPGTKQAYLGPASWYGRWACLWAALLAGCLRSSELLGKGSSFCVSGFPLLKWT